MEKITESTLSEWGACPEGKIRFLELFPEGATLKVAADACAAAGRNNWGLWLYENARRDDRFKDQASDGYLNSGDLNSGDLNSGHRNSGHFNSGDFNSGDLNSGDFNSGDLNSGDFNSGDYNSGDYNSGYFNSVTPEEIIVFNRPCKRSAWAKSRKPCLLRRIETIYWADEGAMTDEEKKADPGYRVRGGHLRTRTYKEAWKVAWDSASQEDRDLVKLLPNFDADVFFEITGIRVC